MMIFMVTGLVSSISPPFWLLMLVRLLPAFLHPALVSAAIGAATASSDKADVHKMMAIVIGGVGLATITTVPFATFVADLFNSWQASFIIQTVISVIAVAAYGCFCLLCPLHRIKVTAPSLKS